MPTALVIRAAGTNCEIEVCHGFEMAGATPRLVHLDALIRNPHDLDEADIIAFPGGFSYGDDIASGRIFAMKLREKLYSPLRAAALRGCPMIGVCNGFQVLVQVGLLPGPAAGESWPEARPPTQTIALSDNKDARYACQWLRVEYSRNSPCIWTRGLADAWEVEAASIAHRLPIGHGEGRLSAQSPAVIAAMERNGQVPLRYIDNVNGSEGAIAGVCDVSGRIFGLMPHPDRFLFWSRHPFHTRLDAEIKKTIAPGAMMFRNAVEAVSEVAR